MKLHIPTSLRVTYDRSLVLLCRRCNTLRTSGSMNDVIFSHNGPRNSCDARMVYLSMTRSTRISHLAAYMLKLTNHEQHRRGAESGVYDCLIFSARTICQRAVQKSDVKLFVKHVLDKVTKKILIHGLIGKSA